MAQFITDAQLTTALEALLKVPAGQLAATAPYWATLIADANLAAYRDVQGRLLARGVNAIQIDTWDRGAEFEKDIGLYWCLVKGVGYHGYDADFVRALDRRRELDSVELFAGGVPMATLASVQEGLPTHGDMSTTADLFAPDPNDRRRGKVTRW